MAPERLRGQALSYATDIYALAITFYEIFSMEIPFGFVDESDIRNSQSRENSEPRLHG